ncbi:BlaI/MecI/CopY family transcriptional regulator [Lachnotalea sp. AF33-28]|uniref:BlaI/MecI/CopY family transcriptional regulator n=1 Tax=Lachnotalea sp. AF33-28 TaxID=2292046 RepID=UPI000E530389|nr:BlaI/MecI/CopY family transcriptional regulator [Lachnotalea sp. AF33-28]RHP34900.1 hypothetical protein DWZ56_05140 [Lachnotalea sp. AF33-28]
MGHREDLKSVSEAEWQVMKVLWQEAPLALPQILERLKDTGWSQTTIQTYLSRLVKKGVLTTQKKSKGYLYSPQVAERDCQIMESRSFIKKVFDGNVKQLFCAFLGDEELAGRLSQEDIQELLDLLGDMDAPNGKETGH